MNKKETIRLIRVEYATYINTLLITAQVGVPIFYLIRGFF